MSEGIKPVLTQVIVCRPANPEDYGDERTSRYRHVIAAMTAKGHRLPAVAGSAICHYCDVKVNYSPRHVPEIERFLAQGIRHEFVCIVCLIEAGAGGPDDKSIHVNLDEDRP